MYVMLHLHINHMKDEYAFPDSSQDHDVALRNSRIAWWCLQNPEEKGNLIRNSQNAKHKTQVTLTNTILSISLDFAVLPDLAFHCTVELRGFFLKLRPVNH